jgi:hypothetical protein
VRLAGLTDDLTIRDQLLQLAQDWVFAAQRERPQTDDPGMVKHDDDLQRRSDHARVVPLRKKQDDHNDS